MVNASKAVTLPNDYNEIKILVTSTNNDYCSGINILSKSDIIALNGKHPNIFGFYHGSADMSDARIYINGNIISLEEFRQAGTAITTSATKMIIEYR